MTNEFPRVHEYHGTPEPTLEDVVSQAKEEGVELGVRQGRVTMRGGSVALTRLVKQFEKRIVEEHFGKTFNAYWD